MAAMAAARAMGATGGQVVSYAHSGDLPIGERDRVVGYGAVVFAAGRETRRPPPSLRRRGRRSGRSPRRTRKRFLRLARETISRFLTMQMVPLPRGLSPAAMEPRGVFVTLKKHGEPARLHRPDDPGQAARRPRRGDGPPGGLRGSPLPPGDPGRGAEAGGRDLRPDADETGLRPERDRGRAGRRPPPEGGTFGGLSPPGRPGTGVGAGRDAGQPHPEGGTPGQGLAGGGRFSTFQALVFSEADTK